MEVTFKDIEGFEGLYQIGSNGQVKSLEKTWVCGNKKSKRYKPESLMKISLDTSGYPSVCLAKNKINKTHNVHRLVAKAFIENIDNKKCVNHINGNKEDNNVLNLEWVTYKENQIHAFDNKLNSGKKGESHNSAKLTEKDVLKIRSLIGLTKTQIAKDFNVTIQNISRILGRKTWAHI